MMELFKKLNLLRLADEPDETEDKPEGLDDKEDLEEEDDER